MERHPEFVERTDTGVFEEGETQCDVDGVMKDAELKVIVWNNFSDTDDGTTYVADFDNIRVAEDAMVFSIAFVPPGTDIGMPPWAANLPELGGADSQQAIPELPNATTIPGAPTLPSSTVAPADSIVGDESVTSTTVATTTASAVTTVAPSTTVGSGG